MPVEYSTTTLMPDFANVSQARGVTATRRSPGKGSLGTPRITATQVSPSRRSVEKQVAQASLPVLVLAPIFARLPRLALLEALKGFSTAPGHTIPSIGRRAGRLVGRGDGGTSTHGAAFN